MIKITQSDYIDFISKSGLARLSKIRSLINRGAYSPPLDYYKNLREELVTYVKARKNKRDLYSFLGTQHVKKHDRFEKLIGGYLKFLGRRKATWFDPPNAVWTYKDLRIKMNPELGVSLNDDKYIIKLYFKDTPLTKSDIKVLLWMMEQTLSTGLFKGYKCALLDVSKSKLHYLKKPEPAVSYLIEGEAESFIKIWQGLEKKSA